MNINRDKHNKYVVNWTPTITTDTSSNSTSQSSGSNTIIYVSGGGGSSSGGGEPTVVEQDSFAYYKISDGTTTIVQAASIPKDTANITFMGDENVQITVSSDPAILKEQFVSTGTNTGTYEISYQKIIVEQEVPVEPEEPDTQAEGETETIQVTTWPLTLTYINGTKLQTTEFDVLNLYNATEDGETLVATFTNTQLTIEGDTSGVSSISVDCGQINFSRIVLSLADTVVLQFDVKIIEKGIVYIQGKQQDKYWKLDKNGNLYTEYNAYSTRELSAYGLSSSEDPTVGALYLKDLLDVSVDNPADNAILQYNSTTQKWEAATAQDLTGLATQEWVTTQITNLKNEIDPQLDELDGKITALDGRVTTIEGKFETVEEAIEQLLDWFSFVDGRIRANYDLWGVGEISAYGYNTSEQPAGKEYLRDLLDVNVDNATNGQILVFNGSIWVSQDIPETGLNESELAQYLTQNNYIQESDLTSILADYATKVYVDNRFTTLIGDAPAELDTLGEIAEQIILLQQMLDWFSFVDGKIRANYDLWGIGEISAYGVGEGSSSSGKNYLHELEDVSITPSSLTSGQLLQYNGSVWVAIDKDEVGLNETELEQYLTTNNYLQQGDVTWSNLSGKPSTFDTTIQQINDLHASWDAILKAEPTDCVTRWPQFSEVTNKPTTLEGYGITDAFTKDQADDRYVNITGDTMTGDLLLPNLEASGYVMIGSAVLSYDTVNKALKLATASGGLLNFYATGEVSAYGMGSSILELEDMADVQITDVTVDQVLVWNGEYWVNSDPTGGINEAQLEQYLQENNYAQLSDLTGYATQTWVTNLLGDYVQDIYVNNSVYSPNGSGRVTLPDYITRYSVDSDGTQVISTNIRLKDNSNFGQYLYFGDSNYVYLAELTDDDLTIHATDLNLDVNRLLLNGEEVTFGISNVATSGNGNIVSNVTASGDTLTITKTYTINTATTSGRLAYYNGTTTIDDYQSTRGSAIKLWYLNAGVPTDSSTTVGSSTNPVYLSSGTITACAYDLGANINSGSSGKLAYYSSSTTIDDYTSTIGSSTKPVYISSGVPTACTHSLNASVSSGTISHIAYYSGSNTVASYSSTIGSGTKLWYLSSGIPTSSSSTVGSGTKPIYLSSGTLTASSSTVGDQYTPVYLNAGTITKSSQSYLVDRGVFSYQEGNWNSGLTPGMYTISSWSGASNHPSSSGYQYGTLVVFGKSSSLTQIYFPHDNTYNPSYRVTYDNSSSRWTSWRTLLTSNNYAGYLDSRYVKKTGDVMTGRLKSTYFEVSDSSNGYRLLNSSGSVVSRLLHDGSKLWLQATSSGYISIAGIGDTQLNNIELQASTVNIPSGTFQVKNSAGYGSLIEVTAGTSSVNSAVLTYKNTGGTLGYLGVSASSTFSGTNKVFPMFGTSSSNNYMIYTNRDCVCFFLKEVDLTDYSTSNFYPFVFNISRGYYEDIEVMIDSEGGGENIEYNTNKLHFIARNGGWSDNGAYLYIINHFMYQNTEKTISAIGRGTQNGTFAVWLRGGKRYSVYHTASYTCDIHTTDYSIQGTKYTVGTNATGGTNINVATWWTPITSSAANRMEFIGTYAIFRSLLTVTASISCTGNITATGNVVAQGEITAYSSSDIRFKTDIHNLTGLDYIRRMRPVEYNWTDEALELKANKVRHGYGLIAQELEQIIPDLVTHNMFNEGYLGIDYTRLVPFTISAIQEVDDEVTRLKKRVKELENKVNKYEKLNRQRTTGINISDATVCS